MLVQTVRLVLRLTYSQISRTQQRIYLGTLKPMELVIQPQLMHELQMHLQIQCQLSCNQLLAFVDQM